MNCNQATSEMIAYLKGELSDNARQRLEEHLACCPECRRQLEEARRLLIWTEAASDEAVVKKVKEIIDKGIAASASDIHFEPQRDNTVLVRYRIDGVLQEAARIESAQRNGVEMRLKMLADMNLEERRVPQDGRILSEFGGKEFDLRISSMPFIYGEGFVLRILDRSRIEIGLDKLGFREDHVAAIRRIIHQPNGMFIVTGPTGSGKTTTLYSILMELGSTVNKIVTIEDPVEYQIAGANQMQVHKKAGLTFAVGLRSFLRHDPDIIMVGETRDLETMLIAVEAAVTGHLVLSTLHTDDAPSALIRMVDMGVEPYMVGATVIGVLAQRLARTVCPKCKTEVDEDPEQPIFSALGITADDLATHKIVRGQGCEACRNTGYKGRIGIYELLEMDRDLARLLDTRPSLNDLSEAARANGYRPMRDDAREKVLAGLTTPEEAFRVLV